ncbi:choline/ethanolamine kinase-like isoform X2 [Ostrea edulis]|uniref:choline/ethanolamine kinase-like isoform X2 n=2 Tax=Ostrea edulis TaxID=37623 RepID=UPI0024AF74D9|nr:choline/ethanolamine kinase-like isoform X2 [Ostrea edulis]
MLYSMPIIHMGSCRRVLSGYMGFLRMGTFPVKIHLSRRMSGVSAVHSKASLRLRSRQQLSVDVFPENFTKGLPLKMGENRTEDVKEKAFRWCRKSLGGAWNQISKEDLQIKPISGGLTNRLYLCSLPDGTETEENEPFQVLMRVYGEIAQRNDYMLRNSVIFALFSEKKKGPKLYGMYPEGRIEEYIPSRSLKRTELQNLKLSQTIAQKLAFFHTLEMPLTKQPNFLRKQMNEWMVEVERILESSSSHKPCPLVRKLQSFQLRKELLELLSMMDKCSSPVVFSHNDLQEGNILLIEDELDDDKKLTVIDWEYGSYNYRGFDFGNHFCEWTCDYSVEEYPYFSYHPEDYPTVQRQYDFFRDYLLEQNKFLPEPLEMSEDALKQLYREANILAMTSHFFWALWSIIQKEISDIEFGYLEYAVTRFEGYFTKKASNKKEGLI